MINQTVLLSSTGRAWRAAGNEHALYAHVATNDPSIPKLVQSPCHCECHCRFLRVFSIPEVWYLLPVITQQLPPMSLSTPKKSSCHCQLLHVSRYQKCDIHTCHYSTTFTYFSLDTRNISMPLSTSTCFSIPKVRYFISVITPQHPPISPRQTDLQTRAAYF